MMSDERKRVAILHHATQPRPVLRVEQLLQAVGIWRCRTPVQLHWYGHDGHEAEEDAQADIEEPFSAYFESRTKCDSQGYEDGQFEEGADPGGTASRDQKRTTVERKGNVGESHEHGALV